jgi:hypothetical protein
VIRREPQTGEGVVESDDGGIVTGCTRRHDQRDQMLFARMRRARLMASYSRHITALAFAFSTLAAVDARAQESFVVRGLGLGTFGTSNTTGLLGVGLGVDLNEVMQITFDASREFGRADPYRRPVASRGVIGIPTVVVLVDSTRVDRLLTGGMRFLLPTPHRLRPFAGVHAGLARVTTRFVPGSIENEGSIDTRLLVGAEGGRVSVTA